MSWDDHFREKSDDLYEPEAEDPMNEIEEPTEDEYFADLHTYLKDDFKGWFDKATTRKLAAEAIFTLFQTQQHPPGSIHVTKAFETLIPNAGPLALFGIYLELLGQSIELLLKSLLIKKHGAFDTKTMKTHNLINLWKTAHELIPILGSLSSEETIALKKINGFVKWAGQYPAPLHAQELKAIKPDQLNYFLFEYNEEEIATFENLHLKIIIVINGLPQEEVAF